MSADQIKYNAIITLCEKHKNPNYAIAMKAYMKNKFEFFGINSPLRKELVKAIKKEFTFTIDDALWPLIDNLWHAEQRELQYIALDILNPLASKMNADNLPALEKMIVTKSWWDTVDMIAPSLIGKVFLKDSSCRDSYVYKWMDSENIWLQRSAIIFQLKYGKNTDVDLLAEAILKNDLSKEFFVRKAQGWALRQYSKHNPVFVRQFVEANPQLSGLTQREALRAIMKT